MRKSALIAHTYTLTYLHHKHVLHEKIIMPEIPYICDGALLSSKKPYQIIMLFIVSLLTYIIDYNLSITLSTFITRCSPLVSFF